jgi:hypothetical protein
MTTTAQATELQIFRKKYGKRSEYLATVDPAVRPEHVARKFGPGIYRLITSGRGPDGEWLGIIAHQVIRVDEQLRITIVKSRNLQPRKHPRPRSLQSY